MKEFDGTEEWTDDVFAGLKRLQRDSVLPQASQKPADIKAIRKATPPGDFSSYASIVDPESIPPKLA